MINGYFWLASNNDSCFLILAAQYCYYGMILLDPDMHVCSIESQNWLEKSWMKSFLLSWSIYHTRQPPSRVIFCSFCKIFGTAFLQNTTKQLLLNDIVLHSWFFCTEKNTFYALLVIKKFNLWKPHNLARENQRKGLLLLKVFHG